MSNQLHIVSDKLLADKLGEADAMVKALRAEFKKRGLDHDVGQYYDVNLKHSMSTRVAYKKVVDLYDIPQRVISKFTTRINEARFYIKPVK